MSASLLNDDFALTGIRGDVSRFDITVTVRDEDGVVVEDASLAGWKLFFTAKKRKTDEDEDAVFAFNTDDHPNNLEITDPAERTARLTLLPADFDDLLFRDYALFCDLKALTDTGDVVTLARGSLELALEITRAAS